MSLNGYRLSYSQEGPTMNEMWLRCLLYKGMFSDEMAIKYSFHGKEISVFVPKQMVNGEPDQQGTVKVKVFEEGGTRWAVLPNSQSAVVPIEDEDLIPA